MMNTIKMSNKLWLVADIQCKHVMSSIHILNIWKIFGSLQISQSLWKVVQAFLCGRTKRQPPSTINIRFCFNILLCVAYWHTTQKGTCDCNPWWLLRGHCNCWARSLDWIPQQAIISIFQYLPPTPSIVV